MQGWWLVCRGLRRRWWLPHTWRRWRWRVSMAEPEAAMARVKGVGCVAPWFRSFGTSMVSGAREGFMHGAVSRIRG